MRDAGVILGLALFVSTSASHAQTAEQIVRLPSEIEYNASLRPDAPPAALLFGDVAKPACMSIGLSSRWALK
jgi:hypothetical protein